MARHGLPAQDGGACGKVPTSASGGRRGHRDLTACSHRGVVACASSACTSVWPARALGCSRRGPTPGGVEGALLRRGALRGRESATETRSGGVLWGGGGESHASGIVQRRSGPRGQGGDRGGRLLTRAATSHRLSDQGCTVIADQQASRGLLWGVAGAVPRATRSRGIARVHRWTTDRNRGGGMALMS